MTAATLSYVFRRSDRHTLLTRPRMLQDRLGEMRVSDGFTPWWALNPIQEISPCSDVDSQVTMPHTRPSQSTPKTINILMKARVVMMEARLNYDHHASIAENQFNFVQNSSKPTSRCREYLAHPCQAGRQGVTVLASNAPVLNRFAQSRRERVETPGISLALRILMDERCG